MRNRKSAYTLPEIEVNYQMPENGITLNHSSKTYDALMVIFNSALLDIQQQAYAVFMDAENRVLGWRSIAIGNTKACIVDIKFIAAIACKTLSAKVILAHNRPSGKLTPSNSEKRVTFNLVNALQILDIELLDYMIVSNNGYFSFKDKGIITEDGSYCFPAAPFRR